MRAQREVTIRVLRRALPAATAYAPLPLRRAWPEPRRPPGSCRSSHDFTRSVRRHGPAFRGPQPAGAGGLYGRDLRQCAAAVLGAAAVHQDGAAAARRLAGGVVGGDGVLPVAAARGLCLCALPDADPQPHDSGGDASGAAGGRAADAAAVDRERVGRAADLGLRVLAARACSRSRSGCRSSRSPPTIRCCRPGSSAPAIPTAPIPISSTPPRISAASWRCCPIRCCWSRCSRCARRT